MWNAFLLVIALSLDSFLVLSCLWWRAYTHTLEISGSDFLDRCAVSVIFPVYSSIYTAVHTAVYLPHDILHDFLYDWS